MEDLAVRNGGAVIEAGKVDYQALHAAWLAGKGINTRRAYRYDVERFAAWLGLTDPTVEGAARVLFALPHGEAQGAVLRYRDTLLDAGRSPAMVNRALSSIKSLVTLANLWGVIPWAVTVPGVKTTPYRDTRGPGREAVDRMIGAAAGRGDEKGARDTAILRLLLDLGLRRGEVVALDREHLDLAAGTVSIMGKGRRERETLDLPAPTVNALAAWLAYRGDGEGPLFYGLDPGHESDRLTGAAVYQIVTRYGAAPRNTTYRNYHGGLFSGNLNRLALRGGPRP